MSEHMKLVDESCCLIYYLGNPTICDAAGAYICPDCGTGWILIGDDSGIHWVKEKRRDA